MKALYLRTACSLLLAILAVLILALDGCAKPVGDRTVAVATSVPPSTTEQEVFPVAKGRTADVPVTVPTLGQSLPNCASLVLSDDTMRSAKVGPVPTTEEFDRLREERPSIRDVGVDFWVYLRSDPILVGEPIDFLLVIANETHQTVILYFPRSPVSLGPTPGAFEVRLRREDGRAAGCQYMKMYEIPDGAFLRDNFIELPAQSQCEWPFRLEFHPRACSPEEIPGPGWYILWYTYSNISIGPEPPLGTLPLGVTKCWDVGALLGFKESNRIEFTIVRSENTSP